MSRKIKLIKAASFTGYGIKATKKNPVVDVDEAAAELAVASGFFEYADDAPVESSPAINEPQDIPFYEPEPEDVAIENMTLAQLKEIAAQMGISTKGLKSKASYIDAIEKSAEEHGA